MTNLNEKGIVYLIQPPELVGINRYKIGHLKIYDIEKAKNKFSKKTQINKISQCDKPLDIFRAVRILNAEFRHKK